MFHICSYLVILGEGEFENLTFDTAKVTAKRIPQYEPSRREMKP